jgi:hypothetical protein
MAVVGTHAPLPHIGASSGMIDICLHIVPVLVSSSYNTYFCMVLSSKVAVVPVIRCLVLYRTVAVVPVNSMVEDLQAAQVPLLFES